MKTSNREESELSATLEREKTKKTKIIASFGKTSMENTARNTGYYIWHEMFKMCKDITEGDNKSIGNFNVVR